MTFGADILDLGEWAEARFSALCAAAGVTRNKAIQDRTGWDYLIEFPARTIEHLPADMQPGGLSARVQVKSKQRGQPSVTLKLSNVLHLARANDPCFVVLFLASDGGEPVRIYARHIWKDLIADSLKRARLSEVEGRTNMNRQTLSVRFGPEDEHTADLLTWVRREIEAVGGLYGEKKNHIVQTVGMEDGGIHGTISLQMDDWTTLVDHQIGLTASAPVTKVTIQQRRFGIDAPLPLLSMQPDTASMRPTPRACRVRVRGADRSEIWLDGEILAPAVPGLPAEYFRLRVTADFLQIVYSPDNQGPAHLNADPSERRSLRSLVHLVEFVRMAREGPVDVQVRMDGKVLFAAECRMQPGERFDWTVRLEPALEMLAAVARPDGPEDLTLTVLEIDEAWNAIVDLNALVAGEDMEARLTLANRIPSPINGRTLVAYDYANVGGWSFLAIVARDIQIDDAGSVITIRCGKPRILDGFVRPGDGADHLDELISLHKAAVRAEGEGAIELFDGSFRSLLAFEGAAAGPP